MNQSLSFQLPVCSSHIPICTELKLPAGQELKMVIPPIAIGTIIFVAIVAFLGVVFLCCVMNIRAQSCVGGVERGTSPAQRYGVVSHHQIRHATVERFLREIKHEKPFRFTPRQVAGFTRGYATRLGAGGFSTVFRGALPNGLAVAVKVFHASLDQKSEEAQFIAEVGTIGRTHHVNLVRLFGFCFDDALRALVYEYMEHGALDAFLLLGRDRGRGGDGIDLPALRDIAVGVARGIRYLHEECQQKIVHDDIKPGNVLLDGALTPKVADFGLARLVNRGDTHVSVSRVRGTPGYAAPEMWMMSGVTEKCDVYSFGMLLLEIVGRRRNFDEAAPESQQWFPMLAWNKYDRGELTELVVAPSRGTSRTAAAAAAGDELEWQQCKEMVERMCKVAFWCVRQLPEARPPMSAVTKMLVGEMDVASDGSACRGEPVEDDDDDDEWQRWEQRGLLALTLDRWDGRTGA